MLIFIWPAALPAGAPIHAARIDSGGTKLSVRHAGTPQRGQAVSRPRVLPIIEQKSGTLRSWGVEHKAIGFSWHKRRISGFQSGDTRLQRREMHCRPLAAGSASRLPGLSRLRRWMCDGLETRVGERRVLRSLQRPRRPWPADAMAAVRHSAMCHSDAIRAAIPHSLTYFH
jgi:hypothetical protein